MTLQQALEARTPSVRLPIWSDPHTYLRLPLFETGYGPWSELYDDGCQEALGIRPGSQRLLVIGEAGTDTDYETYDGPVSPYEQHPDNFAKGYKES